MTTKIFSKVKRRRELPYLVKIQKDSWRWFWEKGLKELFEEVSPIRDYSKKKFELYFKDYKLGEPNYKSDYEARDQEATYSAPLKATLKLVNLITGFEREQEVFLCDFPLMTGRGTFIINGVERVIVSQLIRSPGAFFPGRKIGERYLFEAKIIPNRGSWLEFETEPSGVISVKIDRRRKVPVTTLLRAFGWSEDKDIKKAFTDIDKGEKKYIDITLEKDSTSNQAEAVVEIYQRLRPGEMVSPDAAKEFLDNMFFNFERYDLSKVGRWKMWQRLPESKKDYNPKKIENFDITPEDRVLNPKDVLYTVREIIRMNNDSDAQPDQIDHLGNRRLRIISELLQNNLRIGLMRMARIIKDRMSILDAHSMTPLQLINPRPFMAAVNSFFATNPLSQFMDNENPLAELEHKRRVVSTGPGGLTRERAGFEVRDVQPSSYGRICPIETPEGPNIGLVGYLAGYARVNPLGFIETPYLKVDKGKVTSKLYYLSAFEEEKYNIAHGGVSTDSKGNIIPDKVEARIKGVPGLISKDKIDFIDVSPEQFISIATSLIPFLQNTDANRALMGSNMQRQAVPLLVSESPLVGTGVEEKVARDSGQMIEAPEDGEILEADASHIKFKSKKGKIVNFTLRIFNRTNQYTCFHQRPRVKPGQKVKRGDILAEGGAIKDGRLSLGRNLLVAFVPFIGGNYEDAIVISEKLVREDILSSIHIENFTCDVRETKLGPEMTTYDIPNVSEEKLKDLDEEGIVRIGAEVGPNDILVGKISPKGKAELTAEEKLLGAIFGEKAKDVKDTSLLMEHGKRGRVVGVKVFERSKGYPLEPGIIKRVEVEVAELRKIGVGDKLSGRHGNKGVISMVLPEEDMPFLEDGTPVDIVLNPLGVVSRMNLGQILETHLGLAAKKLGYHAITPALSGAKEEDIETELKKAGFSEDGKMTLYDGRTGMSFKERATVGYIYMLKLIHMAEDKIHARSIGPYSLITQQPLGGKSSTFILFISLNNNI